MPLLRRTYARHRDVHQLVSASGAAARRRIDRKERAMTRHGLASPRPAVPAVPAAMSLALSTPVSALAVTANRHSLPRTSLMTRRCRLSVSTDTRSANPRARSRAGQKPKSPQTALAPRGFVPRPFSYAYRRLKLFTKAE